MALRVLGSSYQMEQLYLEDSTGRGNLRAGRKCLGLLEMHIIKELRS